MSQLDNNTTTIKNIFSIINSLPNITEDEIITGSVTKCTNNKISRIRNCAFQNCSNLTSVSFPACTNIGSYAFQNCTSLTSVSFPVCTSIGDDAFAYCSNLTTVSFPACTNIGSYAFYNCSNLTSLYFAGSSIATLSSVNAFYSTPVSSMTDTGAYGFIYVPSSLVASYKVAANWSTYSSRIKSITS